MKSLAFALLFLGLAAPAIAQQSTPEPEFNDVFVRLDGSNLIPLERETSSIRASGGGFMVASSKASYELPGPSSPVRFKSGQALEFVVRTPLAAGITDPTSFFLLRKLTPKKKTRELVFSSGKFTPFGGTVKTNMDSGALPVTFSKYGESSIKITTPPLEPGEYAIGRLGFAVAFCFGVD